MSSLSPIFTLISNSLEYPENQLFAAILGESPSKGARSPRLWNAAFQSLGMSVKMLPMDVNSRDLTDLLTALAENPFFIGGAIAVPHKVAVADWLGDALTPEARAIGAVNSLFRNKSGQIIGTNTDGEAARTTLVDVMGSIEGKTILVLGGGGAGKAVAAYMASGVGQLGRTLLACRSHFPSVEMKTALGLNQVLPWDAIPSVLAEVDVVVNCTTVGTLDQTGQSPLSPSQLTLLSPEAVVYDIIYQPRPTQLLILAQERGLRVIDGLSMNLEQAVIAFGYAVTQDSRFLNDQKIRQSMSKV